MARQFTLPTARTFGVGGTARLSATTSDPTSTSCSAAMPARGRARHGRDGHLVRRAARLARLAGATSAIDDNPKTAWTNSFGGNIGSWIQMHSPTPTTISKLNLQVIADGQHSVPTTHQLVVDGKADAQRCTCRPSPTAEGRRQRRHGAGVASPRSPGTTFRFVITGERREITTDYFSHGPLELPVAIAELGIPGLKVAARQPDARQHLPPRPAEDRRQAGRPAGRRLDHRRRSPATGSKSSSAAAPLKLSAGTHTLTTARGSLTGYDLDRLVLSSAAGRRAADPTNPFPGTVRTAATKGPDVPRDRDRRGSGRLPALGQRSAHRASRSGWCSGRACPPAGRPRSSGSATSASRSWSTATPTAGSITPNSSVVRRLAGLDPAEPGLDRHRHLRRLAADLPADGPAPRSPCGCAWRPPNDADSRHRSRCRTDLAVATDRGNAPVS